MLLAHTECNFLNKTLLRGLYTSLVWKHWLVLARGKVEAKCLNRNCTQHAIWHAEIAHQLLKLVAPVITDRTRFAKAPYLSDAEIIPIPDSH